MDSDDITVASAGLGGRSDAAGRRAHLSTRGWEGPLSKQFFLTPLRFNLSNPGRRAHSNSNCEPPLPPPPPPGAHPRPGGRLYPSHLILIPHPGDMSAWSGGWKSAKRRAAAGINRGGGGRFGSKKDGPPPALCSQVTTAEHCRTVQHSADFGPRRVTAFAIGTFLTGQTVVKGEGRERVKRGEREKAGEK